MTYLSVVSPCYNEEESIAAFASELRSVLDEMGMEYEVIFVDDGSRDKTAQIIEDISWPQRRLIKLATNLGHQSALEAGYWAARGNYILTLDSDLQHPPEKIPVMMEKMISERVEVVYAVRENRSEEAFAKRVTARVYYGFLRWLSGTDLQNSAADFRLLSRKALDLTLSAPPGGKVFRLLIPKLKLSFSTVPYKAAKRFAGETKYNFGSMFRLFISSVVNASNKPLFLAAQLSIVFALLALVNLSYVLYAFLAGITVPGWASVTSALLVLFSANFFVLGIFGAYLARIIGSSSGYSIERTVIEAAIRDE